MTGGDRAQADCCCSTLTDTAGKELSWLLGENQIKGNIQCPLRCIMKPKQEKELLVHIPICRAAGSLHTLLTECYTSFTSFGGSFYSQIHLNYLIPLKRHLPSENTLHPVTVLQLI